VQLFVTESSCCDHGRIHKGITGIWIPFKISLYLHQNSPDFDLRPPAVKVENGQMGREGDIGDCRAG